MAVVPYVMLHSTVSFSCFFIFYSPSEMGNDLPGTGVIPGSVGAGQVRMGGTIPGSRGGKRRSGG